MKQKKQKPMPMPPFPPQHQTKPGLDSKLQPLPEQQGWDYRPAGKLAGKVALITGGDSGIGRAVAVLYAREGADVAIVCLPQEKEDAEQTRQAVERRQRHCFIMTGGFGKTLRVHDGRSFD